MHSLHASNCFFTIPKLFGSLTVHATRRQGRQPLVLWTAINRALLARAMVTSWLLTVPCLAVACVPYVEERSGSDSASFRRHSNDLVSCQVTESSYDEVIRNWLRNRPGSAQPLNGLSLGRAVNFPWISRHLADKALNHPRWDARRGKVRVGGLNQFVAALLSDDEFLARLAEPFAGTPYMPVSVSVEKVLVGKATNIASDLWTQELLVPFDAQLWVHLRPRLD